MMKPGVLVISHGSRESGWMDRVERIVEEARKLLATNTSEEHLLGGAEAKAEAIAEAEAKADAIAEAEAKVDVKAELEAGAAEKEVATAEAEADCLTLSDVPVVAAYLELVDGRLVQDGVKMLESQGVTDMLALPLFVSSGSTHVDEIGWALGAYETPRRETDLEPVEVHSRLTYGTPISQDPEIVGVLLDKIAAVSADAAAESVLLIGHGSDEPWFYEAWRAELDGLAAEIVRRGGYAEAASALLRADEMEDRVAVLRNKKPDASIIAVPVFLSEGYFTSAVIPKRLEGLNCIYAEGSLLPHPLMAEWIAHRVRDWLKSLRSE